MSDNYKKEFISIINFAVKHNQVECMIDGLLTPQELEEMILRWRLMNELLAGTSQREIGQNLGISLGKISRGSRLLKYDQPEFKTFLENFRKNQDEDS